MKLGRIQLLMLGGTMAITLHFGVRFAKETYDYLALKENTNAHIDQWEVVQLKDKFALKASYSFDTQEKSWRGLFTLSPPYYLNELSAISDLKLKAKESWTAWYNPSNPQFSALESSFPFSLLVRFLISCSVLVYFFVRRNILA